MTGRILLTADSIGGVWTYALELADGLAGRGVDVILATMGRKLARDERLEVARRSNIELLESSYRLEWMPPDPWADVDAAGQWLLELEDLFRPDVIHLNQYAFGALPWRAPVLVAAHSCVLSWWQAVKGTSAPAEWAHYSQAVRAGIAGADLVVAPSRWMLEACERHYGPARRSRVIPNGREASAVPVGAKEPVVFAAGRVWDEAKNLAALASVARHLDWPVCIAGDELGPDGTGRRLRGVWCLGRLSGSATREWMARAEVYAHPARYEPFGLSALEAALAGCVLVLADIPSLRELWRGCAMLVPPDDREMLRDALRAVIANPSLRRRLRQRSRAQAARFSRERMVEGYLAAYGDLERTGRSPGLTEASTCAS